MASIVVTSFWPTLPTPLVQERVGNPSIKTVHAPHWPSPHPYLGPVKPSSSRKTLKRLCSGSRLRRRFLPLTNNWISFCILATYLPIPSVARQIVAPGSPPLCLFPPSHTGQ